MRANSLNPSIDRGGSDPNHPLAAPFNVRGESSVFFHFVHAYASLPCLSSVAGEGRGAPTTSASVTSEGLALDIVSCPF